MKISHPRLPASLLGWSAAVAIAGGIGFTVLRGPAYADSAPVKAPAPLFNPADAAATETATLSGGCFWGMQGVFEHVKGVSHVVAGYTGGSAAAAQYETVSTGTTGHAESVQITFDPKVISFGQILQIYVSVAADPTELNYQGAGQRHAVPVRNLVRLAGAAEDRRRLSGATGEGACLRRADRGAAGPGAAIL